MPEGSEPINHRTPTPSTIKELYATAFRCGFEGCRKPLYRVNDETGEHLLNSRVAHICARSEGGPRWDPEMSEEANRSGANLILMCLEHATEIDGTPEHFPVELLHTWKHAQIAEHKEMHKAWNLTEAETRDVVQASFGHIEFGVAVTGASCVAAAARAVGTLVTTARQKRHVPREAAEAWQAMRLLTRQRMPLAWDAETGEPLPPPEPPRFETQQHHQALMNALKQVEEDLQPLVVTLTAELHTVRAMAPRLEPWCNWVERAAQQVLTSSQRWPGNPPEPDDNQLAASLEEMTRAAAALSAAWHGQDAEPAPPPPIVHEEVEPEPQRLYREHRALLDSARPWARVTGRAFDAELYARLLDSADFALGLPTTATFLSCDLRSVTGLASKVGRNADNQTFDRLIEEAAALRPLAVAALLLHDLGRMAKEAGREKSETRAAALAAELLLGADWSAAEIWLENRFQVRLLMAFTTSISSEREVADRVADAISTNPQLLEPMLNGACAWVENRDIWDWSRINSVEPNLEDPPTWFPVQLAAAEIRRQHPEWETSVVTNQEEDEVKRLALQVLVAASRLRRSALSRPRAS